MATLFTLRKPMYDQIHSVLNGKVFVVKSNPDNKHMLIMDAADRKVLLESTSAIRRQTEDGFIVTTESGTVYDLVKVSTLIPTSEADSLPDFAYPDEELGPIKEEHVFRHIHYGDGYRGTVYTFDHEISYDEFLNFCQKNEFELINKLEGYAWYEKHGKILDCAIVDDQRIPGGEVKKNKKHSVWTYLVVDPYTD